MKPLSELDHYEVLEVARDAGADEIERAYHVARSAYAEGSLATYSIFGERDTEALRHRIELAWRTLSDPHSRREYDAGLAGEGPVHAEPALDRDPLLDSVARRLAAQDRPLPPRLPSTARAMAPPDLAPLLDAELDDVGGECDGARLRHARVKRGLEIDQLAAITKINPMYLRSIEDDAIEQLPAPVYVRGFVKAYARCVGLDPVAAAAGYMGRFETAQPKRRSRLLGRQPQA
ncbi:MAG: helix-turn-helix domain-containing protein [Deltaproteobacteria bacterium]|nr:helix-turn-helix domain-containing protein [Deltaproteobacteria bacterium]